MRTDHNIFFQNITIPANFTQPAEFEVVNGTGHLTGGYFSTITSVQGLDLLIELMVVQVILNFCIFYLMLRLVMLHKNGGK